MKLQTMFMINNVVIAVLSIVIGLTVGYYLGVREGSESCFPE